MVVIISRGELFTCGHDEGSTVSTVPGDASRIVSPTRRAPCVAARRSEQVIDHVLNEVVLPRDRGANAVAAGTTAVRHTRRRET
jgi:hypothetical protein